MHVQRRIKVGIVGATGYAGAEMVRLLTGHPGAEVAYLSASTDGPPLTVVYPHLRGASLPPVEAYDEATCAARCECVFVALPSGSSGNIAVGLWQRGRYVIDLSGDLRLPSPLYEKWYGHVPVTSAALEEAVYGLTEWRRKTVKEARLVANPGCYATAVLLGLLPLLNVGCLDGSTICIDAKSGVSGAGRGNKLPNQLSELDENFYAYKVGAHQHTPEIEHILGGTAKVLLTTQLLPTVRGIYACMYVPWNKSVDMSVVTSAFHDAYEGEPFVQLLPEGGIPQLKSVRGANTCQIGWHLDERTQTLLVMSAIDNLQKGAAGQALQNFNLMNGYPEETGLSRFGIFP